MRFGMLLLLLIFAADSSAYQLQLDGRTYGIAIEATTHDFIPGDGPFNLVDAHLFNCQRARDGASPSLNGATRIRYGLLGEEISTDVDITIELVPFRYLITTVDGDIVCAPYLPDLVFAQGFE
jgi:hypothetical protein